MAEIRIAPLAFKPKARVSRIKKLNLEIDMTPMVDLGFRLISCNQSIHAKRWRRDADVLYYMGDVNEARKNNHVFQTSYNDREGICYVFRQNQNELEKRKIDKNDLGVLNKTWCQLL